MKTDKSISKEDKLIVESRTENLSQIREFIQSAALEAGMQNKAISDMMLAVDEACTNIIKHAYKSFPDGEIIIGIKYSAKKFTIKIIDYGKSFEPDSISKPNLEVYYKQKRVGGLGLYLMKTLMDEVKYTSKPGKYNQVLLSKYLSS